MSFKKTLLILIVFAVAAGAYYLDQQRVEKKTAHEDAVSRLVAPAKEKITDLTVRTATQSTTLKKTGNNWTLTAPVAVRADKAAVDQILDELDRAKKKDPFDVTDAKLDEYGLKTPAVHAEIEASGDKYAEKFALGADTPDNSESYARIGEEKSVFTVPTSVKSQLNKTPNDLRDKRAIPAVASEATSLTIVGTTTTVELANVNSQWQLKAPAQGKADATKIGDILGEINNAKRSDFVDSTSLNLAQYGLDKPRWKASLYIAGSDPATSKSLRTLELGIPLATDANKIYARLVDDPGVFALPKSLLEKAQPTLDDVRAKEIFSISAAEVGKAVFKVRKNVITLVRDSAGQWHFGDDRITRLDQAKISSTISTLANLRAKKFLAVPPPTDKSGLDDPNLDITLSNKNGTTTETLRSGKSEGAEDFVYGFVPATGQYVGLDWRDPGQFYLTREQLVDKTLFNFSEDAVQKVEITEDSHTLVLNKTAAGAWTSTSPGKDGKPLQVEGARMTGLLYSFTSLAWARTINPKIENDLVLIKTQKLEHPPKQIALFDSGGKELARLGMGGEELKYSYVSKGGNEYYAIDKTRTGALVEALNIVLGKSSPRPKPPMGMPGMMPGGMPPGGMAPPEE